MLHHAMLGLGLRVGRCPSVWKQEHCQGLRTRQAKRALQSLDIGKEGPTRRSLTACIRIDSPPGAHTKATADQRLSQLVVVSFNPRPGRAFSITRPGRGEGWGSMRLPGVSILSVVTLREKGRSISLDEYSRLVAYFLP